MRIGLLTDIHEDVLNLERALSILGDQQVDRIVFLGDVFEMGQQLDEVARILIAARVEQGVWGNHDFGLCSPSPPELGLRYHEQTRRFMRGLVPKIEIEGNLFQHILPSFDPESHEDLWSCSHWDFVGNPAALARCFAAQTHPIAFMGHFHRWLHATPAGFDTWKGEELIKLDPAQKHLVVVHAVVDQCCALFDTETHVLQPFRWQR